MGASRSNPLSPSFKMRNIAGEIPRVQFMAAIDVEVVPSQAWLDAHPPDAEGKRPDCPPAEAELRFMLMAQAVFPSRLSIPIDWKRGETPVGVLLQEPLTKVFAMLGQADSDLADSIRGVLAAGEMEAAKDAPTDE